MKSFLLLTLLTLSLQASSETIPNFLYENGQFISDRILKVEGSICDFCTGDEFPKKIKNVKFYIPDYLSKLGFKKTKELLWQPNNSNEYAFEVYTSLKNDATMQYNHISGSWIYDSNVKLSQISIDGSILCKLIETKNVKLTLQSNKIFKASESIIIKEWVVGNQGSCILSL